MAPQKFFLTCLCCCLLLIGCREPFEVNVPSGSSLLVVSGLITDDPGPYLVELTRSNELSSFEFPKETGAMVTLESMSGESEILTEETDGNYYTSVDGIQGVVGEQYRITIQTQDEKTYQSDWKLLKQSPAIDSVYFEYRVQDTEEGPLEGLQTYVDTHDPENNTQYYRYQWVETWEVHADLPAQWIYTGNDTREIIERKEFCWNDQPSTSISIATSEQNATDIISRHPIVYVSTETTKLRFRHSLLVQQYAMDQQEYLFWKDLKEFTSESGTFFDKQPQSITGNIHRVNSDEPVLGYFSASTISESRIFLVRQDLPDGTRVNSTLSQLCFDGRFTIPKSPTSEEEIQQALNAGRVFFDWVVSPGAGIIAYVFTTPICADCTERGGTTEKPDYWPQ